MLNRVHPLTRPLFSRPDASHLHSTKPVQTKHVTMVFVDNSEILNKYNYQKWRYQMQGELERNDLHTFIESDHNTDSAQARLTRCFILEKLDNEHALKVVDCFTACQIWRYLESLYEFNEMKSIRRASSCSPPLSISARPRNPSHHELALACDKCRQISHKTQNCPSKFKTCWKY